MVLNKKIILVTGAGGFVGSHIINRLLKEDAEIHAVYSKKRLVKNGLNSYSADIKDRKKINSIIKKVSPEIIFHLAAFPDKPPTREVIEKTISTNISGTTNILEAAKEKKPLIINIGSYKEYGKNKIPFREDMSVNPQSPYAISKAAGEMLCKMYYELFNVPFVSLRFPTIYGPGQKTDLLIPHVISSCLRRENIKTTKGEQKRELIYIEDAINSLIKAASTPKAIGEIINIGTGEEIEIKKLIKTIIKLVGNPIQISFTVPYRKNEIWHMKGDTKKAKNILNFNPRVSLEEALKRTIGWYRSRK